MSDNITPAQKVVMKEVAREVVKEAVPEAVKETLSNLGIDTSNINEVQKDFIWLRQFRQLLSSAWSKAFFAGCVAVAMYIMSTSFGVGA